MGYRLATTAKLIDVGPLVRQAAQPGRLTQCDAAAASDRFATDRPSNTAWHSNADRRAAASPTRLITRFLLTMDLHETQTTDEALNGPSPGA